MAESPTSPLFVPNMHLTVVDYRTLQDDEPSVFFDGYCPYCKGPSTIERRAFALRCERCGERVD